MKINMAGILGALGVGLGLIYAVGLTAQPRVIPQTTAIQFQIIRTGIACIYVAGTTQTGISIAAVRHEGEECQ